MRIIAMVGLSVSLAFTLSLKVVFVSLWSFLICLSISISIFEYSRVFVVWPISAGSTKDLTPNLCA